MVALEQMASIADAKVRRTLAWALHIPPEQLDLPENSVPTIPIYYPLEQSALADKRSLSQVVFDTFLDNLRMR